MQLINHLRRPSLSFRQKDRIIQPPRDSLPSILCHSWPGNYMMSKNFAETPQQIALSLRSLPLFFAVFCQSEWRFDISFWINTFLIVIIIITLDCGMSRRRCCGADEAFEERRNRFRSLSFIRFLGVLPCCCCCPPLAVFCHLLHID